MEQNKGAKEYMDKMIQDSDRSLKKTKQADKH